MWSVLPHIDLRIMPGLTIARSYINETFLLLWKKKKKSSSFKSITVPYSSSPFPSFPDHMQLKKWPLLVFLGWHEAQRPSWQKLQVRKCNGRNIPFRAPASQPHCHRASQWLHTAEPCRALCYKVNHSSSAPRAEAISSPYPLPAQLPSIWVLSSGGSWWGGNGPNRSCYWWIWGVTTKLAWLLSFPPHVRPVTCHHIFRARQLPRAVLAWTKYIQQKIPVLNTWVLLLMLAHYWVTEFVPKFLTEKSSTSQKLLVLSGRYSEKQVLWTDLRASHLLVG